jgi:cell filamentation protein
LRSIDISEGSHSFAHHSHLVSAAGPIFKQLADEKLLAGLAHEDLGNRAAYYLGELNALHPFREGNGRAQREFISHLAHANGYYISWEHVDRTDMLRAAIESFQGDISRLMALIRKNLHLDL